MKILLINPSSEHEFSLFVTDDYRKNARTNQMPLGLLYLESYLRPYHEVKVLDMSALDIPIKSIHNELYYFEPDIIGITCVIGKWPTVKALAKEIKSYTKFHNIPIIIGGINPSLYPWETLQCYDIDYVVSGFGQVPLRKLCNAIDRNDNVFEDPNIYHHKKCTEKIKGSFPLENVDNYPMPDRSILDINDYKMPFFSDGPATSMITSAGCPYNCHFCASKNLKPVKLRSPQNIVKEMKAIQNIGISHIIFNDELFTMTKRRIKEICSLIISEKINLTWSIRSRANLVDKESIEMMAGAGCINIHLGIESGTDRILEKMNKKITVDLARKSVETIKKSGLKCTASFMLGYVTETEKEIMQTIQFAKDLDLNNCQFFITQPESGTALYEEVKAIKGLPEDIYSDFVLNPDKVDLTKNIASDIFSREQMGKFIKYAYSQTKNLYDVKGE